LGNVEAVLDNAENVTASSDVVFAALPHGVGEDFAKKCFDRGAPFIDISADFRFDDDGETYTAWYDKPYKYPELHSASVYGLPEMNRHKIKAAEERAAAKAGKGSSLIIANPGCYPTAATLGAMPALKLGIAGEGTIIVDSASGITGGGREPMRSYHFPECSDSMSPYKIGAHRHTPEISRNFASIENRLDNPRPVIFTPHLAPMNRGILSTIYIPLGKESAKCEGHETAPNKAPRPPSAALSEKTEQFRKMYADFYKGERFVRVLPHDLVAATNRVRASNFCDISVHIDQNCSTLIVISAIDNMVKGAAGQAVQNMNIVFGLPESSGLGAIPALF
jgi:N-acetyl-gamma-glutamyl-phosphate reductase